MAQKNAGALEADVAECSKLIQECRTQVAKRVVGQQSVVDGIITAFIAGGHVLLEGVPGLAKTLAVRTFAQIAALDYKRIQFTPDLLPADVSGTLVYEQSKGTFSVRKGPVFANVVLADEINRAPAKVQSALLEAMAEGQVTIGGETYDLPKPFFVLATQNPIEQEGTYNLPEAELDRFLLKVLVPYPSAQDEVMVVKTAGEVSADALQQVFTAESLEKCRKTAQSITLDDALVDYIVSLVQVTRPVTDKKPRNQAEQNTHDITRYISFGASPRAGIALAKCARVAALFAGRSYVLPEDVKAVAPAVLRHRLVLSYEAAADGITADSLIQKILDLMPVP